MRFFKYWIILSLLILFNIHPSDIFAQQAIKGKILNQKDSKPLAGVSIKIQKRNTGILSNAAGEFELQIEKIRKSDTLIVSSIGYKTLKISVTEAVNQNTFFLKTDPRELENLILKSYSVESSEGSKSEVSGFFRSWYTKKTGGEIGRILYVNSNDFKLEKVRFKINNQCDTCVIRLHVRDLRNGLPDMDLLNDSISIVANRLSFDDKFSEFDLRPYEVIIKKNKYIFIGFETLYCNSVNNGSCSLCYIGTEDGNFLYRPRAYKDWEESTEHSIYIRLFYKY